MDKPEEIVKKLSEEMLAWSEDLKACSEEISRALYDVNDVKGNRISPKLISLVTAEEQLKEMRDHICHMVRKFQISARGADARGSAIHEAAQMVAGIRFGMEFDGVFLLSDDEFKPHVELTGYGTPKEEIVVHLAGYAARVKFEPETESLDGKGPTPDFEDVKEWLEVAPESSDIEYWIQEATNFVEANWKAISDLAEQLLEHGSLSKMEAEDIVQISDGKESD